MLERIVHGVYREPGKEMVTLSPAASIPPILFLGILAGWWLVRRSHFGTSDEYKSWRKLGEFILSALGIYSGAIWGYVVLWFIGMALFFKGY